MSMYNLIANFEPDEPKNGYIGKADITIGSAIKINSISVFESKDGYSIQFPGYVYTAGDGEEKRNSYVLPKSKEAHAEILNVIAMAVKDDKDHFGHDNGKVNPELSVSGKLVNEKYTDGRFSLTIKDFCTLTGIETGVRNGEKGKFIAVNMPDLDKYEKDGVTKYNYAFEPITSKYEKDGETVSKNFKTLVTAMVLKERSKLKEKIKEKESNSLDDKMAKASKKAEKQKSSVPTKGKEEKKEEKETR